MVEDEFNVVAFVMGFDREDRARVIRQCGLEDDPALRKIVANLADVDGGFNQRMLVATRSKNEKLKSRRIGKALVQRKTG